MFRDMDDLVIQEIARQSQISEAEVRQVYTRELQALGHDARIRDFLPLLAMKQVRHHFIQQKLARKAGSIAAATGEVLRRKL